MFWLWRVMFPWRKFLGYKKWFHRPRLMEKREVRVSEWKETSALWGYSALVWLSTHTHTSTRCWGRGSVNTLKNQTCCYSERKRGPVALLWGGTSAVTDVSFTRHADRKDTSSHIASDLLLWKHGSISVKTLDVPKHEKWKLCKRLQHCCLLDNTSI